MVELDVELLHQLTINGFDNGAGSMHGATEGFGKLLRLVAARQRDELETIVNEQVTGQRDPAVGRIAEHGPIGLFGEQFCAHRQVSSAGRSQRKIQKQPAQTDQPMQPEAEHGHVLAGDLAKIRTVRAPVARRARHPMPFDDWHRPTINGALPIGAQVQQAQATLPNEMASIHQRAVPVKPVLRWHIRKHVLLRFPLAHQRGFFVPRSAFADQRHCQQLAGPALRR